jgi:hypothetical protein
MNEELIPEYERMIAYDQDIVDSRETPQLKESEVASTISKELVDEAEYFLERHEVESGERLATLLQELDTAIAINNDPRARELRAALETRYWHEGVG